MRIKNIRLVLLFVSAYFVSLPLCFAQTAEKEKPSVQEANKPDKPKKEPEKKPELPEMLEAPELDDPIKPPPVVDELGKEVKHETAGGVAGLLQKRVDQKAYEAHRNSGEGVNPLYWEKVREEHRAKVEEELQRKQEEKEAAEEETVIDRDGIFPEKRPNVNYRTELLPSSINKKQYTKENSHLPAAVYEDEYKKILFDSAASGNVDVLRAMVQRMGTTEIRDADGNTPLLYAVMAGNLKSVIVLAGSDAGLNVKNKLGVSPLYAAVKVSRYDIVKVLVRSGADLNITDNNGKTLLMVAVENNDEKMAKMLIQKGVNINEAMINGETALHLAAEKNNASLSKALVGNGADMESKDKQGLTPLMRAAGSGADNSASALIRAGADAEEKGPDGKNAVKLASSKGFAGVAELIESGNIRQKLEGDKKAKTAAAKNDKLLEEAKLSEVPALQITSKNQVPIPIMKPLQKAPPKIPTPYFTEDQKKLMN